MASNGLVRTAVVALVVGITLLSAGCAVHRLGKLAEQDEASGDWDKAVLSYARLVAMDPTDQRWEIALARTKLKASQVHFEKAKQYHKAGKLELSIGELQQVVALDPGNAYAQTELEKALIEYQKEHAKQEMTVMERMKEAAKKSRGVPLLDPKSNIPVLLQFRDFEVGKIYDALSKATGINFLYDPKLDLKKKITIELTNVPFEKAMDTLMLTNKHFFKVMDENTILIADDNQQKRREYEDQVIKTFFLSNAEVKDVQSLLRTMLDARKIVQNEQLNAITIRDTPEKVAIAEKIIEMNDKAKAELVVDVELLEISRTVSKTLGINLTPRQFNIDFTGPDRLPLNNLGLLNQAGLYSIGPIPQVTLDFLKSDGSSRTIAKPQLRVTEGEKANLHIGDSVPIPTTTFNTTGTVGGSVVPITSFTYQEVGIVIEIEPRVHHNREITLTLNVEVSQLGERVDAGQGVSQPSINTRQINTVIRLKDGETNLLAGLIRDDGTASKSGFPGLMDVPGLSKIFSSQTSTRRETDLVLTLRPHIIRIPDIREEDLQPLWIGNEANPRLRGDAGSVFATPFTPDSLLVDEEGEPGSEEAAAEGEPAPEETAPAEEGGGEAEEEARRQQDLERQREEAAQQTPAVPAATPRQIVEEPLEQEPPAQQPPPEAPAPAQPGAIPSQIPPTPTSGMNLTVAPAKLAVVAGGSFSLNLLVNNVVNMQKISFVLSYDPTSVEFDGALEGIIMKQDGTQTLFSANKTGPGQVEVEISRLGGTQGISRGGALAALRFRSIAGGVASIDFVRVQAEDFDGGSLEVNTQGAQVTVSN